MRMRRSSIILWFPLFSNFQQIFTVQLCHIAFYHLTWMSNLKEEFLGKLKGKNVEEKLKVFLNFYPQITHTIFQLLNFVPCQYSLDFADDCPETNLRRSSGEAEEKNEEELQVSKVSAFAASSSLLSPSFTTSTFSLVSCSTRALLFSSLGVSLAFVVAFTDSLLPSEVVRLSKVPE